MPASHPAQATARGPICHERHRVCRPRPGGIARGSGKVRASTAARGGAGLVLLCVLFAATASGCGSSSTRPPSAFALAAQELALDRVVAIDIPTAGSGSGVVIDRRRLLTARHALPGFMLAPAPPGGVPFSGLVLDLPEALAAPGTAFVVEAAQDGAGDWAVLRVAEGEGLRIEGAIPAARAAGLRRNEPVVLAGYPGADVPRQLVLLTGRIAALPRKLDDGAAVFDIRLDRPGDYAGLSGGAVLVEREGAPALAGIVVSGHTGPLGIGAPNRARAAAVSDELLR